MKGKIGLKSQIILTILIVICSCMVKADVQAAKKKFTGKEIAGYFKKQVGKYYPSGFCLRFVANKFNELGAERSSACCAFNYGNSHIIDTGIDNIPVGADVFFGNCGGIACSDCGNGYCGHIGVYVGDGYFVHAANGKVCKSSIKNKKWRKRYRGWGWHGNIIVKPESPAIYSCRANGANSVTIKWNGIKNAKSYQIYRRKSCEEAYSCVKTVSSKKTSITDKGLESGSKYYYRIYAVNRAGKSDKQEGYRVWTKPDTPDAPTVTQISSSGLRIEWDEVEGAGYYVLLRRKAGAENYTRLKKLSSSVLSYEDYELDSGSKYYYKLYSGNSGGESRRSDSGYGYTEETDVSIEPDVGDDIDKENIDGENTDEETEDNDNQIKLKRPVLETISKPNGSIKIRWKKITGAKKYILYRSADKDSGFRKIFETKAGTHSYVDRECEQGKPYYYQLKAVDDEAEVSVKSKKAVGRILNQAELTEISNISGSKKLVLYWKAVRGAESYQVMRKKASGEYKIVGMVKSTKTSFTDKDRTGGVTYTYRVCAVDKNGGRGKYSKTKSQMAIDKNKKMIALTFDDGPSIHTPIVLNAVEKYKVHVTFFVVGSRVSPYADTVKQEAALGCEIGNHTYAHNALTGLNNAQIKSVLSTTNYLVKKHAGVDIRIMRPPGGYCNNSVLSAVGMPAIMWSVDTQDWRTRSTSATIQCVEQRAYDGAIVLMHDLHLPTANAAEPIIKNLKSKGYQMVTVSELAAYRNGMEAGKFYYQFQR